MNEIVNKVLNHPIWTIVIIGAATDGIAKIISAVKGNTIQPLVKITTVEPQKKSES